MNTHNTFSMNITAAMLLSLSCLSAHAASVATFNTGVDEAGIQLAGGAIDPHWQLIAGPGIIAAAPAIVVTNQHPAGQYYSTPNSKWIWSNANGSAVAGTPYTFELQFDLTGYDPSSASLTGFWGADNYGDISFNGTSPVGTGTFVLTGAQFANFNTSHAFTITSGFVSGINKLDIRVVDAGNPGGLNVFGVSASVAPVPVPTAAWLFGSGLIGLTGLARKRNVT